MLKCFCYEFRVHSEVSKTSHKQQTGQPKHIMILKQKGRTGFLKEFPETILLPNIAINITLLYASLSCMLLTRNKADNHSLYKHIVNKESVSCKLHLLNLFSL